MNMTEFLYGFIYLNDEEKKKRGATCVLVIVEKLEYEHIQYIPDDYPYAVYQEIKDVMDKYGIKRDKGYQFTHLTKTPDEIKALLEMEPNFSHRTSIDWQFDNTIQITISINLESTHVFDGNRGTKYTLEDLIDMCFSGAIAQHEIFAKEVILNDKVIANEVFDPSDLHFGVREQLENIQKEHGQLYVVWYEK